MRFYIVTIILFLLISACAKDKAEKAIQNCADTKFSKEVGLQFDDEFGVLGVYLWDKSPENVFDETVLTLKQAGFTINEVIEWAKELDKAEKNDSNKDVINHFIELKNQYNKIQNKFLKLPLSQRLQNKDYEKMFRDCESVRKLASKTFDAKWKKPVIERVSFR